VLHAGVRDHGVQAAEALERRVDDRAVPLARREVRVCDVDAVHRPAVRLELRDDRGADPAEGTGDERDAAHVT
jgi:hypothetical protein